MAWTQAITLGWGRAREGGLRPLEVVPLVQAQEARPLARHHGEAHPPRAVDAPVHEIFRLAQTPRWPGACREVVERVDDRSASPVHSGRRSGDLLREPAHLTSGLISRSSSAATSAFRAPGPWCRRGAAGSGRACPLGRNRRSSAAHAGPHEVLGHNAPRPRHREGAPGNGSDALSLRPEAGEDELAGVALPAPVLAQTLIRRSIPPPPALFFSCRAQ